MVRVLRMIWHAVRRAPRTADDRARRARGAAGEAKVAALLDELATAHRLRTRHAVPLRTRHGRRGDLDHAVWEGRRPRFIIAIETKAERPARHHLEQVRANAQRASRQHFGSVPQYRIVVHPNSREAVDYDAREAAARMGLVHLARYVEALLNGEHASRLVR
jgi:hypothetical protein